MKIQELLFTAPGQVSVREGVLPALADGEVLVETWFSGISAGTELLLYRGLAPAGMALDDGLPALQGRIGFPFKYGYSAVGRIIQQGSQVDPEFQDRFVFAFQPHQSHFISSQDDVFLLPEGYVPEQGIFLPNMETAVNFLMDGRPMIGENVAVVGQGVVGLLTTWLLAQFPLNRLSAYDLHEKRRLLSVSLGAHQAHGAPGENRPLSPLFDLVYELTGSPEAINTAISLTRFDGRVVLGSWYGEKRAALDLGGHFHRSRIQMIGSQVSTIAPAHRGRWTKTRRMMLAGKKLRAFPFRELITHAIPFEQAGDAYSLLDKRPGEALQVLLVYPPAI